MENVYAPPLGPVSVVVAWRVVVPFAVVKVTVWAAPPVFPFGPVKVALSV